MKQTDKAVTDIRAICDILSRCDVIRVGMNADGYPYVIPLTFGAELKDDKIIIYFHSAGTGRKWQLLAEDPRVSVEADLYYRTVRTRTGGVTACYESVIGTGMAERIEGHAEKLAAMKSILDHYKQSGFPVESCAGMSRVEVFRVVLTQVSGKRNL